ncbi:DEAD/DEAH box helicase [Paraflavitalea speifideaquila]|uniref:DEAD/DEAH box helicase n=1 Tax=Paraflavitalea speifideaquila TaxID=3076558 RepID=UPI0028E86E80|nr:DEAD/DEAH box helicase [Paraflavitalea speifideiaquila]
METYEEAFRQVDVAAVRQLLAHYGLTIDEVEAKPINHIIYSYARKPARLNQDEYFKLMLLFGGLKWCDHLGSAMVTDLKMIEYADFAFLEQQRKGLIEKGGDLYQHQIYCSTICGNILLTAPTGSGKTESALLWLRNQLRETGQGRIFYILPYTASINAMYQRIDNAMGDGKAGMLHGKLNDYLNNYFDDLQYSVELKKKTFKPLKRSLKVW